MIDRKVGNKKKKKKKKEWYRNSRVKGDEKTDSTDQELVTDNYLCQLKLRKKEKKINR